MYENTQRAGVLWLCLSCVESRALLERSRSVGQSTLSEKRLPLGIARRRLSSVPVEPSNRTHIRGGLWWPRACTRLSDNKDTRVIINSVFVSFTSNNPTSHYIGSAILNFVSLCNFVCSYSLIIGVILSTADQLLFSLPSSTRDYPLKGFVNSSNTTVPPFARDLALSRLARPAPFSTRWFACVSAVFVCPSCARSRWRRLCRRRSRDQRPQKPLDSNIVKSRRVFRINCHIGSAILNFQSPITKSWSVSPCILILSKIYASLKLFTANWNSESLIAKSATLKTPVYQFPATSKLSSIV